MTLGSGACCHSLPCEGHTRAECILKRANGSQLDVDALVAACDMLEGNTSITTLEVHYVRFKC